MFIFFSATDSAAKNMQLSSLQQHGIAMAIRYGQQMRLLSGKDAADKLSSLLRLVSHLLQQQKVVKNSALSILNRKRAN